MKRLTMGAYYVRNIGKREAVLRTTRGRVSESGEVWHRYSLRSPIPASHVFLHNPPKYDHFDIYCAYTTIHSTRRSFSRMAHEL
jgi:hypothetical protein